MWLYPIVAMLVALITFCYLAQRSFRVAFRPGLPTNTKRLILALGWVCIVFIALIVQGLGQQAVERGWLPELAQEWMFTWGSSILATFTLSVAALNLWLLTRVFLRVQRDEQLVSVMITSPVLDVKASELKLTARELEVLETMAEGNLSDEEIAGAFYISPATAATHVRNILKKANIHNRRDLVLLYSAGRNGDAPSPKGALPGSR
jgi:DNA-binding CsgD family transcriptional regulator